MLYLFEKELETFFSEITVELKFEPKMPPQTSASSFLQKLAYLLPFLISLRNGIPKNKKLETFLFFGIIRRAEV